MVKAVIFDLHGTRIDTEKWLMVHWPEAELRLGDPLTRGHARTNGIDWIDWFEGEDGACAEATGK